jgi:hypothetical protein
MARDINVLSADLKSLNEFTGNHTLTMLLEEVLEEAANNDEEAFAFVSDDRWAQLVESAVDFLAKEGKAHEVEAFRGAAHAFWQAAKSLRPHEDNVLLWAVW